MKTWIFLSSVVVVAFVMTIDCMAQTRMVTHITREGGGFASTVILENSGDQPQAYSLTPYAQDGSGRSNVSGTVLANEVRSFSVTELFGAGSDVSHFRINASTGTIQASVVYRTAQGPGSPAHLKESALQARRWRVFPGDWSVVFDGFAVVNMGSGSTDIQVSQRTYSDQLIAQETAIAGLAPNAKGLYVIGAPDGSSFQARSDAFFEIEASQQVSLMALRGTPPGAPTGYLWENSASPLEIRPDPSIDKWALWTGGTQLRGADLHPCKLYETWDCMDPVTRDDVQDLRDMGANLINASYFGPYTETPPYQVNSAYLAYLDNLVQWVEDVGIFVVLHFRTGPGRDERAITDPESGNHNVWLNQAAHDGWEDMWRYTANRYKESPVVVGYNLMVEPLANLVVDPNFELEPEQVQALLEGTLADWNVLAADITAAIREVDTETPIIVDTLFWASVEYFPVLQPTGDSRTVYSFHNYDPDEYVVQEPDNLTISYPSTIELYGDVIEFNQTWLSENLQPALDFSQQYNVPIFVGETGSVRWVPGVVAYHTDQTALYEQHGWNYAYYVWRGDETGFDGFNLEYGTDPNNHTAVNNSLMNVHTGHWAQNSVFPE